VRALCSVVLLSLSLGCFGPFRDAVGAGSGDHRTVSDEAAGLWQSLATATLSDARRKGITLALEAADRELAEADKLLSLAGLGEAPTEKIDRLIAHAKIRCAAVRKLLETGR
jgi:hypothetical protein